MYDHLHVVLIQSNVIHCNTSAYIGLFKYYVGVCVCMCVCVCQVLIPYMVHILKGELNFYKKMTD